MGRGAWWAAVHGVTKSWTRLSDFTFTFHFHAMEKKMATHSSILAWRIPGTGEPGGLPSMGSHRVGHDWSDLAAAAAAIPSLHICEYIFSCHLCSNSRFHHYAGKVKVRQSNLTDSRWQYLDSHLGMSVSKGHPWCLRISQGHKCFYGYPLNLWVKNRWRKSSRLP